MDTSTTKDFIAVNLIASDMLDLSDALKDIAERTVEETGVLFRQDSPSITLLLKLVQEETDD